MASTIPGGPLTNTSRSVMSGRARAGVRGQQVAAFLVCVVADDELDAGLRALELVGEYGLIGFDYAVEDDRVSVQLVQQRTDGRDADSAGDEQRLLAELGVAVKIPNGPSATARVPTGSLRRSRV